MANGVSGGQIRASYARQPLGQRGTIGDAAGSQTRKNPSAKYANDDYNDYYNDPEDRNRAYTPQEAQQAQSSVDAGTMRNQTKGVAGAGKKVAKALSR